MKLTFTLIALCFYCLLHAQRAGTLDSSFGVNGISIEKRFQASSVYVAPLQGNKFIAAGISPSFQGFLITRYNSAGFVDSTFGNNGNAIAIFASGTAYCNAVTTDSNDEVFAAGNISVGGYIHLGIAKFDATGLPDTKFGENGLVDFDINSNTKIYVQNICLQPDGKIIITAYTQHGFSDYTNAIFRFNYDGSLDKSFGNNGEVFSVLTYVTGYSPVIVQPDGKFLVAGNSPGGSAQIARYNNNGMLDSSFGKNGIAIKSIAESNTFCSIISMALQKDGYALCGGEAIPADGNTGSVLIRFNNEGLIDSSFGNDGVVINTFKYESIVNKILIQEDGKIIGAGSLTPITDTAKFIVARYLPNGNIDSSFGSDGATTTWKYKDQGSFVRMHFYKQIMQFYWLALAINVHILNPLISPLQNIIMISPKNKSSFKRSNIIYKRIMMRRQQH